MSQVLAKFTLTGCTTQRHTEYERDAETGRYEVAKAHPAAVVTLQAVQGEPFGKATPNGAVTMAIVNPAAASIFADAWDRYVSSPSTKAQQPEFWVAFKLDDGSGSPSLH